MDVSPKPFSRSLLYFQPYHFLYKVFNFHPGRINMRLG